MFKQIVLKILKYLAVTVALYPIFFIIITAFKTKEGFYNNMFNVSFETITAQNFIAIFQNYHIGNYILNSLIITVVSIVLLMTISIPGAYALINLKNKLLKYLIIVFFLIVMFVPEEMTIISEFFFFAKYHLVNNLLSVIILNVASCIPETLLFCCALFMQIPKEYEDISTLDGNTNSQYAFNIAAKIVAPTMLLIIISNMINFWNDLYAPLLLLSKENVKPVSLAILFLNTKVASNPPYLMAAIIISTIPLIFLCFCAYFYLRKKKKGDLKNAYSNKKFIKKVFKK